MNLSRSAPHALAVVLLPAMAACAGEHSVDAAVTEVSADRYSYTSPNRDGIGKIYMGREISHVMGHLGAGWLERPSREQEERTDLLLENLPLEAGDTVADIGAGTGYFTFPVSEKVGPDGKVYAVDIQPEMLAIIEERAARENVTNVELIQADVKDPRLPANSLDLVLFVDVYHELEWPREVMEALVNSLKPGGRVALIEYRAEDPFVPIKRLHKMSAEQARLEMEAVGLKFVENGDFLPQQHFLIFAKP